jgi:hypothetical protein
MLQSDVQVSEIRFLARVFRRTEIPAHREKNREFRRFRRFLPKSVSKTSAKSAVCKLNSLRDRTGNQFTTTGKQFRLIRPKQGIERQIDPRSDEALVPRPSLCALSPAITDRPSPGRSAAVAIARRAGPLPGSYADIGIRFIMPPSGLCRVGVVFPGFPSRRRTVGRHNITALRSMRPRCTSLVFWVLEVARFVKSGGRSLAAPYFAACTFWVLQEICISLVDITVNCLFGLGLVFEIAIMYQCSGHSAEHRLNHVQNCARAGSGTRTIFGALSKTAHSFKNSTRLPKAFDICHEAESQEKYIVDFEDDAFLTNSISLIISPVFFFFEKK